MLLGRIGETRRHPAISVFLRYRVGSYIIGAVIPVDGGITTR